MNALKSIFKRIYVTLQAIHSLFKITHEPCYLQRQKEGIATVYGCNGLVGGDRSTNYLQYQCIDCPYFNDRYI